MDDYFKENKMNYTKPALLLFLNFIIHVFLLIYLHQTEKLVLFSGSSWASNPFSGGILGIVFLMLICSIDGAFPKILWRLKKFKILLGLDVDKNDTIPSGTYIVLRQIAFYSTFVMGIISLLILIVSAFGLPIK